ncbi:DUF4085 family protein [Paenibacillus woosongensis]|uniref:DUF4085 family protein n=1 Tax=Paenibacillus woosongensis TaxID=307580 RepID=A0AA95I5C9_9BACL|nr:DUF4085 family protein [Paenibacillus woosongensis]WHX49761.1 DUF4085 family protein [Paenibacillus woosongensis]
MQYFTDELWSKINSEDEEERNEANRKWDKNEALYHQRFQKLKDKLPGQVFDLYNSRSFHDSNLIEVKINQLDTSINRPMNVEITFTDGEYCWRIIYKKIIKLQVDYSEDDTLFRSQGFGDWGYEEILDVNEDILSHEILFSSGSKILIHFSNKMIEIAKI